MIAYVKGELESIETESVVIDVNGMGFRVFTPINEALLRVGVGSQIKLHTYMNVREDAMVLFGFLDKESLELFKLLISVNGVGPKSGLQILSSISVNDLILAIARDDKKALTQVNGIGAKTAARIILDLKDKIKVDTFSMPETDTGASVSVMTDNSAATEAIMALVSLGYSQSEADKAVRGVTQDGMSTEMILKQALKLLY